MGRDAEEKDAPLAGSKEIEELKMEIFTLPKMIERQKNGIKALKITFLGFTTF